MVRGDNLLASFLRSISGSLLQFSRFVATNTLGAYFLSGHDHADETFVHEIPAS